MGMPEERALFSDKAPGLFSEGGGALVIRPMLEEDLPEVLEIEYACFSQPWPEKIFREALALQAYHFLIGCIGDEIAGYCGSLQSFENADIVSIAVRSDLRRRGIGEKLLERLMADGRLAGVERFFLEVRQSNESAIALYEKAGYRIQGRRKNYYDAPREDALIMWTDAEEEKPR